MGVWHSGWMPPRSLAADLETAQRALDQGDAKHALHHIAGALASAPFDERVHGLLEGAAQQTDILKQLPEDGYIGTMLVRAFALRRSGKVDDAIVLLARIAEPFCDRGYESVLAGWIVAARAEGRTIGQSALEQVTRLLAVGSKTTIGLNRLLPGEQALLAGYVDLATALIGMEGPRAFDSAISGMLRRGGRYDDAERVLQAGIAEKEEFALRQQALVLRARGDNAGAAAAFRAAASLDQQDGSLMVEQARCWFVAGEFDRALELLKAAAFGDDEESQALETLCRSRPTGDRLALLDGIRRETIAPPRQLPSDATANIFRDHGAKVVPGAAKVKLTISGWESPSNRLLATLYSNGTSDVTTAEYSFAQATLDFDPLSTRRDSAAAPVWVERDGAVVQAVPAPDQRLRAAIGRIAIAGGSLETIWASAEELGSSLDPSAAADVVAAMVHPPSDPDWLRALPDVLYLHQIAGACVLANVPAPWPVRRSLFESLIFGPIDWVGRAGITALGELARRDPAHAVEIRALLVAVVDDLAPHSCEPRFNPLLTVLNELPAVAEETLEKLRKWYRENDESAKEDAPPGTPLRAVPSDNPDAAPALTSRWVIGIAIAVVAVVLWHLF